MFMSEIKNDLTLKKSNFIFLLCLKIAAIQFIFQCARSQDRDTTFFLAVVVFIGYVIG